MDTYFSTGQVAKLIHCSKQWVSHLCREGVLDSYRLQESGWHHISKSSLEKYIEENRIPVDWSIIEPEAT